MSSPSVPHDSSRLHLQSSRLASSLPLTLRSRSRFPQAVAPNPRFDPGSARSSPRPLDRRNMLYQESSEVFVRHHTVQLACGNMRGVDNGRSIFLPENYQIAVCQKDEKVGPFDEELVPDAHPSERNATTCLVDAAIPSSLMASGDREALPVGHNKRPASDDMADMVECKRLKREDEIISEKDHYTADTDEDVPEYCTYRTCERSLNPPTYESGEGEDEGVDSSVRFSLAHTYVEDHLQSPSFYQREDISSSMGLCPIRKPVPIGPNHQAELPECRSSCAKSSSMDDYSFLSSPSHTCHGTEDESDKWIRNCVMPMPGFSELSSTLIPVYRKAGCDCVDEDSINCVRKHVREARGKLRSVLGSDTFKELGFCDMGEAVASRWTEEEKHLFQEVVSSNPASLGGNFWDELPLAFPTKATKELVSYYFNVFMLRKRAEQNRFDPMNVDSDNDEWQESDDDEFAIARSADEDLPLESLTDQDEGVCNQFPPEENIYEESDAEDELDYASVGYRQENCRGVEGDVMVSEGLPVMSFMDHNKQTSGFDADAQDDSCTSFEAQQVGVVDGTPTDFAEDYYGHDSIGGVAEHGYFGSHCDLKVWEIGFISGREKDEFLSTNNVIEEVFGKGYCENENDVASDEDDFI